MSHAPLNQGLASNRILRSGTPSDLSGMAVLNITDIEECKCDSNHDLRENQDLNMRQLNSTLEVDKIINSEELIWEGNSPIDVFEECTYSDQCDEEIDNQIIVSHNICTERIDTERKNNYCSRECYSVREFCIECHRGKYDFEWTWAEPGPTFTIQDYQALSKEEFKDPNTFCSEHCFLSRRRCNGCFHEHRMEWFFDERPTRQQEIMKLISLDDGVWNNTNRLKKNVYRLTRHTDNKYLSMDLYNSIPINDIITFPDYLWKLYMAQTGDRCTLRKFEMNMTSMVVSNLLYFIRKRFLFMEPTKAFYFYIEWMKNAGTEHFFKYDFSCLYFQELITSVITPEAKKNKLIVKILGLSIDSDRTSIIALAKKKEWLPVFENMTQNYRRQNYLKKYLSRREIAEKTCHEPQKRKPIELDPHCKVCRISSCKDESSHAEPSFADKGRSYMVDQVIEAIRSDPSLKKKLYDTCVDEGSTMASEFLGKAGDPNARESGVFWGLVDGIYNLFTGKFKTSVVNFFSSAWETIKEAFIEFWFKVSEFVTGVGTWFIEMAEDMKFVFMATVTSIVSFVTEKFEDCQMFFEALKISLSEFMDCPIRFLNSHSLEMSVFSDNQTLSDIRTVLGDFPEDQWATIIRDEFNNSEGEMIDEAFGGAPSFRKAAIFLKTVSYVKDISHMNKLVGKSIDSRLASQELSAIIYWMLPIVHKYMSVIELEGHTSSDGMARFFASLVACSCNDNVTHRKVYSTLSSSGFLVDGLTTAYKDYMYGKTGNISYVLGDIGGKAYMAMTEAKAVLDDPSKIKDLRSSHEYQDKLMDLIKRMSAISLEISKEEKNKVYMKEFEKSHRAIIQLFESLPDPDYLKPRQMPLWVNFIGVSRQGKSDLTKIICNAMNSWFMNRGDEKFVEKHQGEKFFSYTGQEFWEGYCGQTVTVAHELMNYQTNSGESGKRKLEISLELLRLIDTSPCNLNMAALGSGGKGNIYFISKLFVSNSNLAFEKWSNTGLDSSTALVHRQMCIRTKLIKKFPGRKFESLSMEEMDQCWELTCPPISVSEVTDLLIKLYEDHTGIGIKSMQSTWRKFKLSQLRTMMKLYYTYQDSGMAFSSQIDMCSNDYWTKFMNDTVEVNHAKEVYVQEKESSSFIKTTFAGSSRVERECECEDQRIDLVPHNKIDYKCPICNMTYLCLEGHCGEKDLYKDVMKELSSLNCAHYMIKKTDDKLRQRIFRTVAKFYVDISNTSSLVHKRKCEEWFSEKAKLRSIAPLVESVRSVLVKDKWDYKYALPRLEDMAYCGLSVDNCLKTICINYMKLVLGDPSYNPVYAMGEMFFRRKVDEVLPTIGHYLIDHVYSEFELCIIYWTMGTVIGTLSFLVAFGIGYTITSSYLSSYMNGHSEQSEDKEVKASDARRQNAENQGFTGPVWVKSAELPLIHNSLKSDDHRAVNTIVNNMCQIYLEGDGFSRSCSALFLGPGEFLTVSHMMKLPWNRCSIAPYFDAKQGKVWYAREEIKDIKLDGTFHGKEFVTDSSYCVITPLVLNKGLLNFSRIDDKFPKKFKVPDTLMRIKKVFLKGLCSYQIAADLPVYVEEREYRCTSNFPGGTIATLTTPNLVQYDSSTQGGDCYDVMIGSDETGAVRIYGAHNMGNKNIAVAAPLTYEMIEWARAQFPLETHAQDIVVNPKMEKYRVINRDVLSKELPGVWPTFESHKVYTGTGGTALRQSPLRKAVINNAELPEFVRECKVAPSVRKEFSVDGVKCSPWSYNDKKRTATSTPPMPPVIRDILLRNPSWFSEDIFSKDHRPGRILTLDEVLFGCDETEGCNTASSLGHMKYYTKFKDCNDLYNKNTRWINPKFRKLVDKTILLGRIGIPFTVALQALKDELLLVSDITKGKVRAFAVTDKLVYVIVTMLFGCALHDMKTCPGSPFVYGYNPHGWQVNDLMSRLDLKGNVTAEDASGNDFSVVPYMAWILVHTMTTQYYGLEPGDKDYTLYMNWGLTVVVFAWQRGKSMHWNYRGMQSGHPLTTILNSFDHYMQRKLCFFLLYPYEKFSDNVKYMGHGDDADSSVNPNCPLYNMQMLSEMFLDLFGIELSSSDKTDINAPYIVEPSAVEFLSRQFRGLEAMNGDTYAVHALKKSSIYGMLNYVRVDNLSEDEAMTSNIRGSLQESMYHGKDFFDSIRSQIVKANAQAGKNYVIPTWKELHSRWDNEYYGGDATDRHVGLPDIMVM